MAARDQRPGSPIAARRSEEGIPAAAKAMTQPVLEPLFSALPPPARLGEVLGGKYRLDRILAVGGMGVVVAATHLRLNQRIAIKFMSVLLGGRGERDTGVWRFLLE